MAHSPRSFEKAENKYFRDSTRKKRGKEMSIKYKTTALSLVFCPLREILSLLGDNGNFFGCFYG